MLVGCSKICMMKYMDLHEKGASRASKGAVVVLLDVVEFGD
jgi:hypothetical protein